MPQAADCLKRVLAQALDYLVQANPAALPLLQRFQDVYVQDGSTVALPVALAAVWPGAGNGAAPTSAALKVQTQFNLLDGGCLYLDLLAGRDSERAAPMQVAQHITALATQLAHTERVVEVVETIRRC